MDNGTCQLPDKQPQLRVKTSPDHANDRGDIFGGWLMSQIDIAGGIAAADLAKSRVATVAVKELLFLKPLFVYDVVSFYTDIVKVGITSVTLEVTVYAQRYLTQDIDLISKASLTYVAIESPGVKRAIKGKSEAGSP